MVKSTGKSITTDQPTYAGEFFDLSITSINNKYGALHNIGVILYGINFPLKKFITELEMILNDEGGGATDDKAIKRQKRLVFLQHCNSLPELQTFFERFCNYLNGQDGSGKQYSNFIVITAAGGNIIIVFAQLINNMIEALNQRAPLLLTNDILLTILAKEIRDNKVNIATSIEQQIRDNKVNIARSIAQHFTTNPDKLEVLKEIADTPASDCDFKLSPNIFQSRDQESESMVYGLRSDMAVLNIGSSDSDMQQNGGNLDEEDIRELITMLSELNIDKGPDIEKLSTMFSQLNIDSEKRKDFILIAQLLKQAISNKVNAGFFLLRAKTLIDCRKYYKPRYTPKQLKEFRKSCLQKYKDLYPQTIQQTDLDEQAAEIIKQGKDPNADPCYIYLRHLMEKKKTIRTSTQMTIDQIIELFVNGYFKQASSTGFMAPVVIPTENNTEAIIAYTKNITSNINTYINMWFSVSLNPQAAPAKSSLQSGTYYYDYESIVRCFLSLDTIIIVPSLIPFLAADIMNYFLNNPVFHTETILDLLINTFNTTRSSPCVMLPSDILLVPTQYQDYLSRIKDILNSTLNSELGYPDGLRITINVIITEQMKDITEIKKMLKSTEYNQLLTEYQIELTEDTIPDKKIPDKKIPDKGAVDILTIKKTHLLTKPKKGGTKYYKKNITLKKKIVKKTNEKLKTKSKKTRRQKNLRKVTLKHKKPRKHKSIKHKYRKHKL